MILSFTERYGRARRTRTRPPSAFPVAIFGTRPPKRRNFQRLKHGILYPLGNFSTPGQRRVGGTLVAHRQFDTYFGTPMKRLALLFPIFVLLSPHLFGQLFQARFVSSAYGWQRFDTLGVSSRHLFGHQSLQLSLGSRHFSFHSNMQGFNDFQGPLKNDPQFRLYDLYVKGSDVFELVDIVIGRQLVFAGVGNGTIDGARASLKLPRFLETQLTLTGYYGFLPPSRYKAEVIDDRNNNLMTGSQLVISAFDFLRASVSYVQKRMQPEAYNAIRRDTLFNPYTIEIKPSAQAEEYASADVNLEAHGLVSAFARYDYDLLIDRTSRIQFFTRVKPIERVGVTIEYLKREPRLSYNSIFWVFNYNTLREWEAGLEYEVTPSWQAFGRFGNISYGDESSNRITAGVNGRYVSFSATRNVGYDSEISAASINAAYPLWENTLTPTLLLNYAQYKLEKSASLRAALSVGAGAVLRPISTLVLDAQLQWIVNKIYKNDLRLFVRCSYLISQHLGIF